MPRQEGEGQHHKQEATTPEYTKKEEEEGLTARDDNPPIHQNQGMLEEDSTPFRAEPTTLEVLKTQPRGNTGPSKHWLNPTQGGRKG